MTDTLKLASRTSRMHASEIRELLKLLGRPDIISFAGGIPDPDLFPSDEFREAFDAIMSGPEHQAALQYAPSEGYGPLREWLVQYMGRIGVPCELENIVLMSGSQQALDYLGKLFLNPGDTALVTWPTYMGALLAFNPYEPTYDRLALLGNRSASDFADKAKAAGGEIKFAYMSSDFVNPTGETLTLAQRNRALDLGDELDIAVIEDGAYQELRYDGDTIPPIQALEIERCGSINEARTIYCGTFSKTLSPGLRVGWVCARRDIVDRLVMMKQAADLHSATINQMAINQVARACFDTQVAKSNAVYRERRDCMLAALAKHMPDGVTWTRPEGGMFIWVTVPEGIDAADLLSRSLETEKVAFVPGRPFFADGSNENTLRLSYSSMSNDQIEEGTVRLGRLLRAAMPGVK
ncbi:MAG: PLP-dependent aminotransferase family protein [Anderseniella sp.]